MELELEHSAALQQRNADPKCLRTCEDVQDSFKTIQRGFPESGRKGRFLLSEDVLVGTSRFAEMSKVDVSLPTGSKHAGRWISVIQMRIEGTSMIGEGECRL